VRVLITTIGSSGDIHPYIAVGRELLRRGHAVEMLVNPHYEQRVRAEGLGYRPLGTEEQFLRVLHHPDLANQSRSPGLIIRELIGETVRPTFDATLAAIREFRPDVVLRHHISLGSRWVCEREGVPCITGVLAPIFWLNPRDRVVYRSWQWEQPPLWVARLRIRLGRWVMRFMFDRALNRERRALGLPPASDQFKAETLPASRVLGLWSAHFRGPQEGDPASGRICGFAFFDAAAGHKAGHDKLGAFLDDCGSSGESPLVFTLGTSVVHHHAGFYDTAAEVCRRLGRRGLLLTGKAEYAPRRLPPEVQAVPYAPFSLVLQRAAAVVHHGGVGTTGQCLRAGVPTVIVPFANDEFDNARRAKLLGTSVTLHTHRLSIEGLCAAMRRVLESDAIAERAEALGRRIRAEDGAAAAADEVEAVASSQHAPQFIE